MSEFWCNVCGDSIARCNASQCVEGRRRIANAARIQYPPELMEAEWFDLLGANYTETVINLEGETE